MAVTAVLLVAAPVPGLRAAGAPISDDAPRHSAARHDPLGGQSRPRTAERFTDDDLGLSIEPPAGWVMSPVTALNPLADPPEPIQESARFQLRILDSQLYAAPIPITSGLVADAGALISIG